MVLFLIQAKEVAIIGPASFRSRHEMLSRPVALFGDNLPSNLKLQRQRYVVNYKSWKQALCMSQNLYF